jgi:hypothetical protein
MTQDFNLKDVEKEMLNFYSNKLDSERTITVKTGSGGLTMINKAIRQSPIREHLKAASDLGVVTATRRVQLFGMLDSDDKEIQKLAEGIILGLKI